MPIYSYCCPECHGEVEVLIPMRYRDDARKCGCGAVMRRLMSAPNFVIPVPSRDKILKTLNKEDGYNFPGGDKHRTRYERAMAKGLDHSSPTIGIGFNPQT